MRFTPQFLDELRARLPVSEVVGRRVKLRKAGREWKGLSPFNQEKTPSFFVNDQKAMWFDFSSAEERQHFRLSDADRGCELSGSRRAAGQRSGRAAAGDDAERRRHEERRKTLHDIVELAAKFFETTLASRIGARGRGYLRRPRYRVVDAAQIPARLCVRRPICAQGTSRRPKIPVEDMVEAGLLVAGDDIPVPYDRFRDRVMFPISDWRGRVIAFGGRALEKDVPAKYLNSPETPLFHKGDDALQSRPAPRKAAHNGSAASVSRSKAMSTSSPW